MALPQKLALARISQIEKTKLRFTTGGDAIYSLRLPCKAYLYRPSIESQKGILPSTEGLPANCKLTEFGISNVRGGGQRGLVEFGFLPGEVEIGDWIVVDSSSIESGDLYFFQIKDWEVRESKGAPPIAHVIDYFETGASGVIISRMADGTEVLIPLVEEHATLEKDYVLAPNFKDFILTDDI